MGKKLTNEEYIKKLKTVHINNIIALEPYIDSHTKIRHKCLKHNFEYSVRPYKVLSGQGCNYCKIEKISASKRKSHEDFIREVYDLVGTEYEVVGRYIKSNVNTDFKHNMKNGDSHVFRMTPNGFLSGNRCSVCHGLQVAVGFNDIHTTNKKLGLLLANYKDGFKYTEWSNYNIDFKCPNCGYIFNNKISNVNRRGLSCPICSDGISYPNKLMFNILLELEDDLDYLEREYSPSWCKFKVNNKNRSGRYDIYFVKDKNKYIIEMDGALGHGDKLLDNSITNKDTITIDTLKDEFAEKHCIKVIRIDCKYNANDRFRYILNNILNSELNMILPLNKVDFKKCDYQSQNSLMIECCKLWNENEIGISKIAKRLKISLSAVRTYLKRGNELGICTYTPEDSIKITYGRKVICITEGKVFDTIRDGAQYYNITESKISKCCRKICKYCNTPNHGKLQWVYLDEYNK
ncbi:hypothetical protein KQI61_07745 [Anaerocolumna aminovalerica]|uniref:hypothetical protein n=1 Tax=Anaerocolumna aminovalerica TaxID=1527 RepID=UPI001C0F2DF0|nr:hypothetical protein [Anaerocolumna aminovalerica]MBU5332089.1 hypothetical protein [Anaerocolumna aminovalerica]